MKHYPKEVNTKYDEGYFTSKVYDKFAHCESQDIFRRQVEMIEDVIGSFNGKKTLDIGGALGWFAKRCQDKGATAYCQDISLWACENSPIKANMRCGDSGEGITFKDNTFDIVTSIEMIEHVGNTKHCFEEVSRVLKPSGVFYCSVGTTPAPSHVWVGNLDEWSNLVNDTCGLSVNTDLTNKMRNHPYCILQNWKTIIAVKDECN